MSQQSCQHHQLYMAPLILKEKNIVARGLGITKLQFCKKLHCLFFHINWMGFLNSARRLAQDRLCDQNPDLSDQALFSQLYCQVFTFGHTIFNIPQLDEEWYR